ncbi:hypothetical protein CONCODRAFT_6394 [Conidiobolus coronatus NRRL 28638]|uniref:Uncharacterized protein n=1 Tax=Conidiobolus coronatus (strain ATCC 28846 / CBS 209.66 / NRRL 28638) TaxID=796925 RepID=A0A137P7F0_CONC2|nr:hypothetical protein CONCODRAFT_6394 [Conidiobolus coronatus NRRL 28638]|eukprot:KXN70947.1 hypothetical protein CONCODRAFT_6394 [Conidiobolus coronatus NRRL 28638]
MLTTLFNQLFLLRKENTRRKMANQGSQTLSLKRGLLCMFLLCLSAVASNPAEVNEIPIGGCIDGLVKCRFKCCESCPC